VDTVATTDTVVRVDTVRIVDTVVALGDYVPDEIRGGASTGSAASTTPAVSGKATPLNARDEAYLRSRRLLIPVAGVSADRLPDTFAEMRGSRRHDALDIPAPRGTPVLSADDGSIIKLHTSVAGGLTIYAADPQARFFYYYAHLDRYRDGLREGMPLHRGDIIGFVGTTGNAPPNVPHLHFAIARADSAGKWWSGTPLDPRPLLISAR
jgi:murein DD-endopeptidase MepM/ murein hydrolase activator NlpD